MSCKHPKPDDVETAMFVVRLRYLASKNLWYSTVCQDAIQTFRSPTYPKSAAARFLNKL